ncbi:MAG TPA: hypothetical protein ENL20_09780 [Candidatus Cloacimonetes bacterium]|nr:hypothetical protein [Candidatus Cloacimonadota bacterium]
MKNMRLFIFIALLLVSFTLSAEEKVVIRFEYPTAQVLKEFTPEFYDIASFKPGQYLDIVVTRSKYEELLNRGYKIKIVQTEQQLKQNLKDKRELTAYRNYNEVLTELQLIEANNPTICKLYDIGETWGKEYSDNGNSNYDIYHQEVWALKVSDNVLVEEDEPGVYYMGTHHAREPISCEVTMAILNHILDNYGTDPTITDNVNNSQIWFIPLVNPNGHKLVIDEYDVWWRKNIRDNNENGYIDSYDGVDPNRNYGWEWGPVGTSDDWSSDVYHGPEAWSEPEIVAMKNLLESHHFVTGITYHSYSELVLFPFGYNDGVIAPDHDALEELAIEMAVTIPSAYGGNYTPQEAWELYPCMGTTDDYSYGQHGIFSFTIELGTEFIPPGNEIQGICDDNIQAAMILLDRVNYQTLTGIITDSETGLPIVAEIYIEGIDNTGVYREPYQSDELFGRYYRLLETGNYDVTFSADGYFSQTFENVSIISGDTTILNVSLEAADPPDISINPTSFTVNLQSDETTDENLRISNDGEYDLIYNLTHEDRDSGGSDIFGYSWKDSDEPDGPIYSWRDISGMGTLVNFTHNDYATNLLPIGFTFNYYGTDYTQFRISPNGWLGFGDDWTDWHNFELPRVDAPKPAIFGFWDDLYPFDGSNGGGDVYYYGNSDSLIVWFDDVIHYPGTWNGTYDFQFILYANGQILLQYRTVSGDIDTSTIGIQNESGDDGLQVCYNENYVHNELAVLFKKDWLSISPASGNVPGTSYNDISLTFDASGLPEGTYLKNLMINSNDPDEPLTIVPINLYVGTIFQPETPQNVVIEIVGSNINISWDAVTGATSYTVYSDADPYGTFSNVEQAGITGTFWSESVSEEKKFYRITASN